MVKFRFVILLTTILCCIVLNSCSNDSHYSIVSEIRDEVINVKKDELSEEMLSMCNTLIKENLLPDSFDVTLDRKVQEINGIEYSVCHLYEYVDYDLVEKYYNLPEHIDFNFSIITENNGVHFWHKEYLDKTLFEEELFITESNVENIEKYFIFLKKFEKEICFFKEYYNIKNDLIGNIQKYFDKKYLIDNFENNKISTPGSMYNLSQRISVYLFETTYLEYYYAIEQEKDTLKYEFIFSVRYVRERSTI